MSLTQILVVGPVISSLMESLEHEYQIHKLWEQSNPEVYLQEYGTAIQGVVTSYIYGADTKLLDALPNLQMIASYGVGIDRIDLETVTRRKIVLTNTPDIQEPVADTAIALLLAVTRKICEADRFVRAGQWAQNAFPLAVGLQGKICGIVGLGRIGKAVAKRAEAFGMKIAYYGPRRKPDVPYSYYDDLGKMAKASDFLILALPGGEETRHIINARILAALGPTGFLINVARGSVVDEAALIESLQSGRIAGAGLDVFEHEPLTVSPLMKMENVVLLPHIASATAEMRQAMGEVVLSNLKAYFAGHPVKTPIFQNC